MAKVNERKIPDAFKPMLAKEVSKPFSSDEWVFEIKWDGYRAIAVCGNKKTLLYSRNGLSFATRYLPVYDALRKFTIPMVIDGEIVALDNKGKSDFQLLQEYEKNPDIKIKYYVFDILEYKHRNLTSLTLLERKKLLKDVLPKSDIVLYCEDVKDDGLDFFKEIRRKNLEGMIAKKKDGQYLPGKRTSLWLKIKYQHTEEVVIAGFTAPQGSRQKFGALVLGVYKNGKLKYAGHTGTGFTNNLLNELYNKMLPLKTDRQPFNPEIRIRNDITWIKPKLVANIRFTEWTKSGSMRHPVFQGLRIDKSAEEMKTS